LSFFSQQAGRFLDTFELYWAPLYNYCNCQPIIEYRIVLGIAYVPDLVEEKQSITSLLTIKTNPTKARISISTFLTIQEIIHLHIFDEVGKDIVTFYDGMAAEGKHDLSLKLPPGMYCARMATTEGVVTKKIIVE